MGYFSVRVVDRDGRPRKGIGVMIDYGILAGGCTKKRTDDDGWVEFHNDGDDPGEIWVDGENMGSHRLSDGKTYSYSV